MPLLLPFASLGRSDASLAGGKGASLGEMTQAGIPVPPGFVILTDAFERFLAEADVIQEIESELNDVDQSQIHTVERASERIQARILDADLPEEISSVILESFRGLGAAFVAVRSSATAEDSASAAWAGQLDSFLNTTEETLLTNVKRCWASLFTPRAIFYRFEQGLRSSHVSVAVVVQKMVESTVSGIAFSVHPVTEDRDQIIIEAGLGLGEAIVSGQVTPDSYVISKKDRRIIDTNISEQSRGIFRKQEGGNEWRDLGAEGAARKLEADRVLELSDLVIRIEDHYGLPQDIEWAFEGDSLYIVQSRPITTLTVANNAEDEPAAH